MPPKKPALSLEEVRKQKTLEIRQRSLQKAEELSGAATVASLEEEVPAEHLVPTAGASAAYVKPERMPTVVASRAAGLVTAAAPATR